MSTTYYLNQPTPLSQNSNPNVKQGNNINGKQSTNNDASTLPSTSFSSASSSSLPSNINPAQYGIQSSNHHYLQLHQNSTHNTTTNTDTPPLPLPALPTLPLYSSESTGQSLENEITGTEQAASAISSLTGSQAAPSLPSTGTETGTSDGSTSSNTTSSESGSTATERDSVGVGGSSRRKRQIDKRIVDPAFQVKMDRNVRQYVEKLEFIDRSVTPHKQRIIRVIHLIEGLGHSSKQDDAEGKTNINISTPTPKKSRKSATSSTSSSVTVTQSNDESADLLPRLPTIESSASDTSSDANASGSSNGISSDTPTVVTHIYSGGISDTVDRSGVDEVKSIDNPAMPLGRSLLRVVHASDLAGVYVRKSNISRLLAKYHSPSEKLVLNVASLYNHQKGQAGNVLTLRGVQRMMQDRQCKKKEEFIVWIQSTLIPILQGGANQSGEELNINMNTNMNTNTSMGSYPALYLRPVTLTTSEDGETTHVASSNTDSPSFVSPAAPSASPATATADHDDTTQSAAASSTSASTSTPSASTASAAATLTSSAAIGPVDTPLSSPSTTNDSSSSSLLSASPSSTLLPPGLTLGDPLPKRLPKKRRKSTKDSTQYNPPQYVSFEGIDNIAKTEPSNTNGNATGTDTSSPMDINTNKSLDSKEVMESASYANQHHDTTSTFSSPSTSASPSTSTSQPTVPSSEYEEGVPNLLPATALKSDNAETHVKA